MTKGAEDSSLIDELIDAMSRASLSESPKEATTCGQRPSPANPDREAPVSTTLRNGNVFSDQPQASKPEERPAAQDHTDQVNHRDSTSTSPPSNSHEDGTDNMDVIRQQYDGQYEETRAALEGKIKEMAKLHEQEVASLRSSLKEHEKMLVNALAEQVDHMRESVRLQAELKDMNESLKKQSKRGDDALCKVIQERSRFSNELNSIRQSLSQETEARKNAENRLTVMQQNAKAAQSTPTMSSADMQSYRKLQEDKAKWATDMANQRKENKNLLNAHIRSKQQLDLCKKTYADSFSKGRGQNRKETGRLQNRLEQLRRDNAELRRTQQVHGIASVQNMLRDHLERTKSQLKDVEWLRAQERQQALALLEGREDSYTKLVQFELEGQYSQTTKASRPLSWEEMAHAVRAALHGLDQHLPYAPCSTSSFSFAREMLLCGSTELRKRASETPQQPNGEFKLVFRDAVLGFVKRVFWYVQNYEEIRGPLQQDAKEINWLVNRQE